MSVELTSQEKAYFTELALDIVAHGGLANGQSIESAMLSAHERRMKFAEEMAFGQTWRAKIARKLISSQVYSNIRARTERERFLRECEEIAR